MALSSTIVALLAAIFYTQSASVAEAASQLPLGWLAKSPARQQMSTAQASNDSESWDILRHLGGNSPWISKTKGILTNDTEPPAGCLVEQVHMMSRHAERYPTVKAGIRMLQLYQRIQHANMTFNGSLAFAPTWDFFMPDPAKHFESLVSTGPYAGTLEAFSTGVKLRTRYKHLLDAALGRSHTSFWASDSKRVIETARYFGAGFFGIEWEDSSKLHVISEGADLGADTLTPGDTCLDYANNINEYGHDYGADMLTKWRAAYIPNIVDRLSLDNPGVSFSVDEVYTMQEICGFETITHGRSHWCDVFTHEEWEAFEYARDVIHYYRAGSGNPYGAAMGWLWLNATTNLLEQGPDAGPLFFSFVHDGDIVPLLAALDLLHQSIHLPTTHVLQDRLWQLSDVVPMGGRIIFERLVCTSPQECWNNGPMYPNHIYCSEPSNETFVRININDGIVALPGCDSGPGSSCPLGEFSQRVKEREKEVGDFGKVCGLSKDAADKITFLHQ